MAINLYICIYANILFKFLVKCDVEVVVHAISTNIYVLNETRLITTRYHCIILLKIAFMTNIFCQVVIVWNIHICIILDSGTVVNCCTHTSLLIMAHTRNHNLLSFVKQLIMLVRNSTTAWFSRTRLHKYCLQRHMGAISFMLMENLVKIPRLILITGAASASAIFS